MRTVLPAHHSTSIGKDGAFSRPINGKLTRKVLSSTRIPRRGKGRLSAMESVKGILAENPGLIFTSLSHAVVEVYHQNEGLGPLAAIIGGPDAATKARAVLTHLAANQWIGSVATAFSTMRNHDEDLRQLHITEITEWRALHKPVGDVIGVPGTQRGHGKKGKGLDVDVRDTDRAAALETRMRNQCHAQIQLAIDLTKRVNKANGDHALRYAEVAVAKVQGALLERMFDATDLTSKH